MTFGGTGMSMSFENCSSVHSDRWTNDNEGGGAIRAEMLVFTDMGDLSFNGSKSIVNADTNAGGAVNVRGDATFSNMGNISFTNNELGDSAAQGQALGGAPVCEGYNHFREYQVHSVQREYHRAFSDKRTRQHRRGYLCRSQ